MLITIGIVLLGFTVVAACEFTRGQIRRLLATPPPRTARPAERRVA